MYQMYLAFSMFVCWLIAPVRFVKVGMNNCCFVDKMCMSKEISGNTITDKNYYEE